jgi:hypothetical protein
VVTAILNLTFSPLHRSLQLDEVVTKSVWALSCINELKLSLLESGAISAISSMMKRRLNEEIIQILGRLTSMNLLVAIEDYKASAKDVQELVEATVDSMEYHHNFVELLECSCYILTSCMFNYSTIFTVHRAVRSVSTAISTSFNDNVDNNIYNNENLLHIFFCEAFNFSLKVRRQKNIDSDQVYEALNVFFLAIHHTALDTLLTEQAIYDVLVVLEYNNSTAKVVLLTIKILVLLSDAQECCRTSIISKGGVDSIIHCIRMNQSLEDAMEKGFHLLTSLCTDEQGSLALLAADGIDLVLDAMKEYEESFAVQKAAFAVISNICSSAIIANSTEQIVINVLHAINKFDQSFLLLKEECCRALWGLLSIENNLEKTWEMST